MGKAKKERIGKGARLDPIFSNAPLEDKSVEQAPQAPASAIPPVLAKLDSLDAGEREWACSSLANMALEASSLQILLQHNVIKRLSERLVDTDPLVQVGAAGALRNLAVEGGEPVCLEMMKKDVLSPAVALFLKAVELVKGIAGNPTTENLEKKGIITNFLEQLLVVMWCLCENFDKATDFMNVQDAFFVGLMELLSQKALSNKDVVVVAAQFLNTVTEDNPVLTQKFASNPNASQFFLEFVALKPEMSEEDTLSLSRILGASIIFNLRDAISPVLGRSVLTILLPIVAQFLKFDAPTALTTLLKEHPDYLTPKTEQEETEDGEKTPDMQYLFKLSCIFKAQQVALELLSNISSDSTTEDEWQDEESMEDDNDDGAAVPMDDQKQSETSSSEAFEMLGNTPILLQLVLEKSKFLPAEISAALQNSARGRSLLIACNRVQIRAVGCINNLVIGLKTSKIPSVQQWWDHLFDVGIQSSSAPMAEPGQVLAAVTGACWSIARNHPLVPNRLQLEALRSGASSSPFEETRLNCVGILGILAQAGETELIVQDLLNSLKDSSQWVVAESVNAFFDIFGEKDKNDIFQRLHVANHLKQCQGSLDAQKKLTFKKDKDLHSRLSETLLNLKRFIEYKKNEN